MAWAHGLAGFQLFELSGVPETIEIIEIGGVGGSTPEPLDFNYFNLIQMVSP